MDEPFSALDEQNRTILQQELLRIWEADKKTVVFITHSVDEAVTLADKIMVMTASPGRAKTVIDVSLERPRNVLELRNDPRYGQIVYGIWGHLKDEVERARLKSMIRKGHRFRKRSCSNKTLDSDPSDQSRAPAPGSPQQTCSFENAGPGQFTIISVNGLFIGLNSRRRGREDLLCFWLTRRGQGLAARCPRRRR
jgi:hypothetical protein